MRWEEDLEAQSLVSATFHGGGPALAARGNHHYLATWPDEVLLRSTLQYLSDTAGLRPRDLPNHVRLRRIGNLTFAFNYGPESFRIEEDAKFVLGGPEIESCSLAAWRS